MLEKEYLDILYLQDNGFVRKKCKTCGKYFWTADKSREVCGDPPCGTYTFINNPVFKRKFALDEMREFYLSFFEKRGHRRIERYPVVARWRDDIYLTIASIADFQPFVTSGVNPPPANPLTISQPCIRMDDLDSVGKTGRHLTLFEMMAHHAFNYAGREIYWKSETVQYCTELLEKLGVQKEDIVYKEEPWAGGGNAGPCLEAIVGGIELATLVFMNLEAHPEGEIEIKGEKYRKMENYIVDTGYGLERFTWASQGTPTVYDAIFEKVLEKIIDNSEIGFSTKDYEVRKIIEESSKVAGVLGSLKGEALVKFRKEVARNLSISVEKLEKIIVPLEKVYALADHTRAILFMLGDGLVPSNAGAGYLARLMIRRSLRLSEEIGFTLSIFDLIKLHRKILASFKFEVPLEVIEDMLQIEEERYRNTIRKGIQIVERVLKKRKKIEKSDLIEFYNSHGIPAEIVEKIAKEKGVEVEIPRDFYAELALRYSKAEKEKEEIKIKEKLPKTRKIYYENPKLFEFNAKVVRVIDNYAIFDQTAFYPEGGGQECDRGYILFNGNKVRVLEVKEENGVILHKLSERIREGVNVRGVIDKNRRLSLMRHHSATHILLHALQKTLGKHVWQTGVKKEENKARLDITHYKKLTPEEVEKIEILANREVMENKPITWGWMDRIEAEKKYGFRLYQGGVPPGKEIRIVKVGDDIQACGGTHCNSTGEIGLIKILRVDPIQDGVLRFEFAAGEAAIKHIRREESYLREASQVLRVEPSILPKTVARFFEEWKVQKKEIDRLLDELAVVKAEKLEKEAEEFNSIKVIAEVIEADIKELIKIGKVLAAKGYVGCLLGIKDGVKVVTFSGIEGIDARDLIKRVGMVIKGGGGGKRELAQGAGQVRIDKDELMNVVFEFLRCQRK